MDIRTKKAEQYKRYIVTDNPDMFVKVTLETEDLSKATTEELRKRLDAFCTEAEVLVLGGSAYVVTEEDIENMPELTAEEAEKVKSNFLYSIGKDTETGEIDICPMNEQKTIKLHGAEDVKWFVRELLRIIQS